jgi:exonuclease III
MRLTHSSQDHKWWLTCVYGPSVEGQKASFLDELNELRLIRTRPWLLCGDFNMIYRAEDKNNDRLDRHRMGQFYKFINEALLKEIHLQGRLFT